MLFSKFYSSDWRPSHEEIEINTLEELLALFQKEQVEKSKAGKPMKGLIVNRGRGGRYSIEVYDDWRE